MAPGYSPAMSFTIDSTPQSYAFLSLDLQLSGTSSSANVTPSIWNNVSGHPGSRLLTLNSVSVTGSTPTTYTVSVPNLTLNANATYWIVLDGAIATSWTTTLSESETSSGSWTIGNSLYETVDSGATWQLAETIEVAKFGINTIVIPEPSSIALAIAGFGGALLWRRRAAV